jgi:uncharacterized membrane protein YtjA (UPF0391 family)
LWVPHCGIASHAPIAGISIHSGVYPIAAGSMVMLYYALVFLVIAVIAGILGFTGIAGVTIGIAKILFFVFLLACILSFFFGRRSGL